MRLILGVDGGQTSLKCTLADERRVILGRGQGRGILHLAAEDGPQTFQAALAEAAAEAWAEAGLPAQPLAALALGLTGVSAADTPEAHLAAELAASVLPAEKIRVENDALIALLGAHDGKPGIIVIAGTGAIALGMDGSSRQARAGGWGWLLGDEGSAFWIGREGLRAALRAQEGWGEQTSLVEVFKNHFQITHLIGVKRSVFNPQFGAQGFASLAPMVSQAAQVGDGVAQAILQTAGQELGALALAVARQLDEPLPVAGLGGAFEHFYGLRQAFNTALATASPLLQVVPPAGSPLDGSLLLARRMLE